jgi:uncharacterized protein DUF262
VDFHQIPQLTRANYQIDVPWDFVEQQLEHLNDRSGLLVLEPDFQRAHVWSTQQQQRYVEWILRGGTSGKDLMFNCSSWMRDFNTEVVLVDGLQRLTAVRKFLKDEIAAFNTLFSQFSGRLPIHASFRFHVNDLKSRKQVLRWYLDINSAGTAHAPAELEKVRELLALEK